MFGPSTRSDDKMPIIINNIRFRNGPSSKREIIVTVNTQGKVQYWEMGVSTQPLFTLDPFTDDMKAHK